MLHIKKEEAMSLLQKMRQIRQSSGEAIALLEHTMQLQERGDDDGFSCYNPDDYLESFAKKECASCHCENFLSKGDDLK